MEQTTAEETLEEELAGEGLLINRIWQKFDKNESGVSSLIYR